MHCIFWAVLQNIINCLHRFDSLQWSHNGCDGVSNHQPHDCLFNRIFRCWSKKTSNLLVTGLCAGNSPVTREFPHKGAVTRKMFSIWWRHHVEQYLVGALSVFSCRCIPARDTISDTQIVTLSDSNELTGKCNRSTNKSILFKIK